MKKILCLVLMIIVSAVLLVSCGGDDVPEGMQLVLESKSDGYVFYGPEGWIVTNRPGVAETRLSGFNKTSITFVKAEMPSEKDADGNIDFNEYFENSMVAFPYDVTMVEEPQSDNFGKADAAADKAVRFVYTYKYVETDITCMQILLTRGEDFFIFTYTSLGTAEDENSYYRIYLEKARAVCDNFKFTEKVEEGAPTPPALDAEGYYLASDKVLSGFELYLPAKYKIVDASALVSAKISDKANISFTQATETGVGVLDYLLLRRERLSKITDSFTDVKITVAKEVNTGSEYFDDWTLDILPEYDSALKLGNLDASRVAAYEYIYTRDGNTYHVYQVLGTNNVNGYVFTYTALEDEYSEHIDEIKTILEKVRF